MCVKPSPPLFPDNTWKHPGIFIKHTEKAELMYIRLCGLPLQRTTDQGPKPQQLIFLTIPEARSPRSGCQQGWFLLGPLSLAAGSHLLPVSSCGLSFEQVCILISSS